MSVVGKQKLPDRREDRATGFERAAPWSKRTAGSFENGSVFINPGGIWQSRDRNSDHRQIEKQQANADYFLALRKACGALCFRLSRRYDFTRCHDTLRDHRDIVGPKYSAS